MRALFAGEGAHVYVTDVDGAAAETVAGEIVKSGGARARMAADVSRGQDVTAMFRAVEKAHGRLDVLVNNAGLNVRGDFRHLSDADWVKIREVNLDGVVRVARDGFALLQASGAARSSTSPRSWRIAACASSRPTRPPRAPSSALTAGLAVEYAPFDIRVNALAPGFVETALTERALSNPGIHKALLDSHAAAALRHGRGDRQGRAVPGQRRCLLRHRRRARRRRRHVGGAVGNPSRGQSLGLVVVHVQRGLLSSIFVAFWAARSLTVE